MPVSWARPRSGGRAPVSSVWVSASTRLSICRFSSSASAATGEAKLISEPQLRRLGGGDAGAGGGERAGGADDDPGRGAGAGLLAQRVGAGGEGGAAREHDLVAGLGGVEGGLQVAAGGHGDRPAPHRGHGSKHPERKSIFADSKRGEPRYQMSLWTDILNHGARGEAQPDRKFPGFTDVADLGAEIARVVGSEESGLNGARLPLYGPPAGA